ncbi:hypothetical protein HO173_011743 [Letharia columbiana]|uniref:AB hydrolase-1 domain-containing protein n=1 Tax=Letharia columbiana TaxID=112416 RepID=A0A8H6FI03_9LECA|nr:uncharacterized protein HO173_011743 [Letharia columbiana]KAF6228724.1 hypothetical protein HO173_011743 [Letharia columbiana]
MEPHVSIAHESGKSSLSVEASTLPATYAPFLDLLSKAEFIVRRPHLPTTGDVRPPNATSEDDVTTVRAVAFDLASAGHPIIVLAHSYSGLVASEAVTEELYAKHGNAGVVRLIIFECLDDSVKVCLTPVVREKRIPI